MVGDAQVSLDLRARLSRAAQCSAPVLLEGATGTGKELAAVYIHERSDRARGPFVTLDCASLGEDDGEGLVFGREYLDHAGRRCVEPGLFELAAGGTLFLDHIGEMPPTLQAKLLRALETGDIRRVGSRRMRRADVRVLAATSQDLRGHPGFRPDLYFRIACVRIRLPTLAERIDDIPVLVREVLRRIAAASGRTFDLTPEALALLRGQAFPGNIRELGNLVWTAAIHSDQGRIDAEQLARVLSAAGPGGAVPSAESRGEGTAGPTPEPAIDPPATLRDLERQHLQELIIAHGGSRRAMAAALRVSERTVYRKLKRHGLF